MKVSAIFNGVGLQLRLVPENEAEQRMVGAVLNLQLTSHASSVEVNSGLVTATARFFGHHTNQRIEELVLAMHRQEQPA